MTAPSAPTEATIPPEIEPNLAPRSGKPPRPARPLDARGKINGGARRPRTKQLLAAEVKPRAGVVHPGLIELDPRLSGSDGLQRIGLACIAHIRRNEAAALAGNAEAVHQMRVGIRRLRAALSAFAKMLPAKQRRRANEELRRLAGALAAARNLDVFDAALVAPARRDLGDIAGLAALLAALSLRREAAQRKAAKMIGSAGYAKALRRISRWFERRGWSKNAGAAQALATPIGALAPRILGRRRHVAMRRSKGFPAQSAAERHRLRIDLKKLRYSAELLGGLYDSGDIARFTKPLRRLQDDLGEVNDLRVGRKLVAELTRAAPANAAIGEAGRAVLDWHERRLRRREPALLRRLERLRGASPFWSG